MRQKYKTCEFTNQYRTIDGSCNNLLQPWWGERLTPFQRLSAPAYDDRLGTPRVKSTNGALLPSARLLATRLLSPKPTKSKYSALLPYFGQLVAHDLVLTVDNGANCTCEDESHRKNECFNIPMERTDSSYTQDEKCLPFRRSCASMQTFDCYLGPREQLNKVTHFLDLSNLFGNTVEENQMLRYAHNGLLKYSIIPGSGGSEALPFCQNERIKDSICFLTGDEREGENVYLSSLHTIFLKGKNE